MHHILNLWSLLRNTLLCRNETFLVRCADHVSYCIYSIAMVSQVVSYVTATFVVKINGSTDFNGQYFGCKERT